MTEAGMKDGTCAALDFGSNTVTLAVYRMGYRDMQPLFKEKAALGVLRYIQDGVISDEGIRRAADAIAELKSAASALTDRVYCFATASLRGVTNAQDAVEFIRRKTGVHIELLSGEQEAYYDYVGLVHHLPHIRDAVALDIGGGSMEIVHIHAGRLKHSVSLPTGSLKLTLEFSGGRFPSAEERSRIEASLKSMLEQVAWLPEAASDRLYTIGGTARAVARLHKAIFNRQVDVKPYSYLLSDLNPMLLYLEDESHFQQLRQLIPDRMQTIVPGIIAMQAVSNEVGARAAVVSKYGVREGYLLDKKLSGKIL
jgi:exopolyphosphatase/guanosine-5'-triphosphate,3'-diphosphate pyrophosphatase